VANAPQPRQFEVNPINANYPPLLLGLMGPPGGGKTKSALRLGEGMGRFRGGKPALIDTEAGRALRYHVSRGGAHDFDYIPFTPPFVPAHFMDAIRQADRLNPSCIIVDSASDEHEGEGGVLDWHDQQVPTMGGNEWAAWSKPKASRRVLISGMQQIRTPLIFTFRAREKTVTQKVVGRNGREKDTPVNVGFMPIAPAEIVHTLDLTCLLPPRANGVPRWESEKSGEDFVIKLPEFLARFIERGAPLDERLGEALARWQAGEKDAPTNGAAPAIKTPAEQVDAYVAAVGRIGSLDELADYQAEPKRARWIATIREKYPDLSDRIITANSARYAALQPAEVDLDHDDDRLPPIDEG
jgi:AAA domain